MTPTLTFWLEAVITLPASSSLIRRAPCTGVITYTLRSGPSLPPPFFHFESATTMLRHAALTLFVMF